MLAGLQDESTYKRSAIDSFTFREYERLLIETLKKFSVGGYNLLGLTGSAGPPVAIFRHDIDMSPEAAHEIAKIEARHNVRTSYTVLLGGPHYNPFQRDTNKLLNEIVELGHDVGLHFPCQDYQLDCESDFVQKLTQEAAQLSHILGGKKVNFFSYHDPTPFALSLDLPHYGGMLNAYSSEIRNRFEYCSDSNGYWRFRDWHSLIAEHPKNIHLLTHPEWWSEVEMSPAEKVFLRLEQTMKGKWRDYCENLDAAKRPNHTSVPRYVQELFPHLENFSHDLHRIWLQQDNIICEANLLQFVKENLDSIGENVAKDRDRVASAVRQALVGSLRQGLHE